MIHPYIGLTEEEVKLMLQEMGLDSIDKLFEDIPSRYFLKKSSKYSKPLSEWEVRTHIKNILSKNRVLFYGRLFIGGGVWPHVVPSIVRELLKRGEFYSSYTPYQPEVSQGVLQALFEYQSLMAELL
ncbi:MAG: glycine dehydrogenase, partial [Nitrososphaerota archaeon]